MSIWMNGSTRGKDGWRMNSLCLERGPELGRGASHLEPELLTT